MKRRDTCAVDACEEPVKHPESGLCGACYSGLYYWSGATPTELLDHRRKLARCRARMDLKLGNVADIRKGRKVAR